MFNCLYFVCECEEGAWPIKQGKNLVSKKTGQQPARPACSNLFYGIHETAKTSGENINSPNDVWPKDG